MTHPISSDEMEGVITGKGYQKPIDPYAVSQKNYCKICDSNECNHPCLNNPKDDRLFKTTSNEIEHDLHLTQDPHCSLCIEAEEHLAFCIPEKPCTLCLKEGITCGAGNMYKSTCEMCEKYAPKKCYFHTDYYKNTNVADNYPPNFNPKDLE